MLQLGHYRMILDNRVVIRSKSFDACIKEEKTLKTYSQAACPVAK